MMMFLGLMGIVVFTHASERKESKPAVQIEQGFAAGYNSIVPADTQDDADFDCTMSAKVTISAGVAKIEVSCTASGATCEIALATAEGCVSALVKRISSVLK